MAHTVRELGAQDLDALLALYRELHPDDDPLPPRAALAAQWERICADAAYLYLGTFEGEALVASCCAAIVPNLTRGARPYAVVENVVCHRGYRRQGHATAALQALIESCRRAGCYKVMLLSGAGRAPVHAFYERNGFDKHAKQGFLLRF